MLLRILLVLSLATNGLALGNKLLLTTETGVKKKHAVVQLLRRGVQGWLPALAVVTITCVGWLGCEQTGVRTQRVYLDKELHALAGGKKHVVGISERSLDKYDTYKLSDKHHPKFYRGMLVHYQSVGKSYVGQAVKLLDEEEEELLVIINDLNPEQDAVIGLSMIQGVLFKAYGEKELTETTTSTMWVNNTPITTTDTDVLLREGGIVTVYRDDAQSIDGYPLQELRELLRGGERLVFSDAQHVIKITASSDDGLLWEDLAQGTFVIVPRKALIRRE